MQTWIIYENMNKGGKKSTATSVANLNLKVDRHTGEKWLIHGPKHRKCKSDNKEVQGIFGQSVTRKKWTDEVDKCRNSKPFTH